MSSAKWIKRLEKEETSEMKEKQLLNKIIFGWGLVVTAFITIPPMALGLSYHDLSRGFMGGLVIWLLLISSIMRLQEQKKKWQSLMQGFLIGEVVIAIPTISTYLILIILGQEEFIAEAFAFFVGLVSFSMANVILATIKYRLKNELFELQLAERGFKHIKELQEDLQSHE